MAKDFHQKLFFGRKKVTSLNKKKTDTSVFFGFCSDRSLGLGSVFLSSLTVSNKAHRELNVVAYQSPAVLKGRIKNAPPPLSLGIRSLSNERVPLLASFVDINFRPTNPKTFLKAPWAPIYINFQG